MPEVPDASLVVVGLIALGLLVAGPSWGEDRSLGEGTAQVEIVSPDGLDSGTGPGGLELRTTAGRFGAAPTYVRTPDLVVDVTNLTGRPKVVYRIEAPELNFSRHAEHLVTRTGRHAVPMDDRAFPPPDYAYDAPSLPPEGTYEARIVVRVQSFAGSRTVLDRTVPVVVDS